MARHITASHPDYPELNDLTLMLGWAINPGWLFDDDLPDAERAALVTVLRGEIAERLEGGIIRDWLNNSR